MKKKKVAIVLSLEPRDGGGYQYALLMAECIKKMAKSCFELIAICTNRFWWKWCKENHVKYVRTDWIGYTAKEIEKNIRYPVYSRLYNMYMTEVGMLIRKENIDVIVLTGQLMYTPNLDVKMIAPVFDLMHRYEPSFPEVKKGCQERDLLFRCQAKYVDYILADSELGKRQFCESYLRKNREMPYVISLPFVVPGHISKVEEEYIDVPDKYVFYPAQFWKHKNHINLIKAIQILKDRIDDIHLVLVGSEKNCYREVKRYIQSHCLENKITTLGFVSNENMVYLYRHAAGMVMPTYFGPTNIPPLEAMALGCPVAVSNKYAMPEQVGKAGLLFNPDSPEEIASCIKKIWTDEKLRVKMIEQGYKRVQMWGQREFEKKIFSVIKKSLNR